MGQITFLARWWGVYFLYFFVIGVLSIASLQLGSWLTKNVVASATAPERLGPRALSRVELHAGQQIPPQLNAVHSPARPVVALVRPDIHPMALAAGMDRSEGAQIQPVAAGEATIVALTPPIITVASCDVAVCDPTRVKGWKKALAAKRAGAPKAATLRKTPGKTLVASSIKPSFLQSQLAAAKIPPLLARKVIRLADSPGDIIRRSLSGTS
ncbi:MAG: hypothetical protein ABL897_05855 [Hyphomicrobium sp.]